MLSLFANFFRQAYSKKGDGKGAKGKVVAAAAAATDAASPTSADVNKDSKKD